MALIKNKLGRLIAKVILREENIGDGRVILKVNVYFFLTVIFGLSIRTVMIIIIQNHFSNGVDTHHPKGGEEKKRRSTQQHVVE